MIKPKSISLLGWILVLLQLLNPFLHAHAQGLDGTSGFHVHGTQNWHVAGDQIENPLLMAADAEHWVLGMPTAHRTGENAWSTTDNPDSVQAGFRFFALEAYHSGGVRPLEPSPPGWHLKVSFPPPALAPPSI